MSLRLSGFFLTFLLCVLPLFGSRALAQAAELVQSEAMQDSMVGGSVDGAKSVDGAASVDAAATISGSAGGGESGQVKALQKVPEVKMPASAVPCLRDLGVMDCILTYGFGAIEFHAIGEEVIARFQRLDGTVNDADVIVMSSHLEDAALNDRINLDESPVIFAQFQRLSGARYEIPKTANEVKRSLGFSEETSIAPVDWLEILKVHLERTLSTTPTVSDLILDLLGVELNPVVIEAN